MEGQGIGVRQNVPDGLVDLRRSRDGGVAQGVVKDVFQPYNGGLLPSVFKQFPDAGTVGA